MYADCLSLASLTYCFTKSTNDAFELTTEYKDFECTIGSIVYKQAQGQIKQAFRINEDLDIIIRANLVGGRTQLFRLTEAQRTLHNITGSDRMYQKGPFVSLDFVSLYSTVMYNTNSRVMHFIKHWAYFPYDIDLTLTVDEFLTQTPTCYIICVSIDQSHLQHKIIGSRLSEKIKDLNNLDAEYDSEALNWHLDIIPEKYITNIEYDALIHYGCKVSILDKPIYTFKSSQTLFRDFIDKLYKIKAREDMYKAQKDPRYNPSLRAITKILLNALSGKYAQRNFLTSTEIIQSGLDSLLASFKWGTLQISAITNLISTITGEKLQPFNANTAKPSYVSMFIYAHARMLHYRMLINPEIETFVPVYCDTDSVYLPESCYESILSLFGEEYFVETEEHLARCIKYIKNGTAPTPSMLKYRNCTADEFHKLDPKTIHITKSLGQIQLEHYITESWYYNAKDYAYISDGALSVKVKGIHIRQYDTPLIQYHSKVLSHPQSLTHTITLTPKQDAIKLYLCNTHGYLKGSGYDCKVEMTSNGLEPSTHKIPFSECQYVRDYMSEDTPEVTLTYDTITYDDKKIHSGVLYESGMYYSITFSAYTLDPCAVSVVQKKGTCKKITKAEYSEAMQMFKVGSDSVYFECTNEGTQIGKFRRDSEYYQSEYTLKLNPINRNVLNARLKMYPINFITTQFKKKWSDASVSIVRMYKTLV
jgi:hypothetical protein